MEARDGARRVTQRQLQVAEAAPIDPPPPVSPEPLSSGGTPVPRPPLSRGPSDLALRERQARWLRERARYEASDHTRGAPADASK
jgi:hypothetical protein